MLEFAPRSHSTSTALHPAANFLLLSLQSVQMEFLLVICFHTSNKQKKLEWIIQWTEWIIQWYAAAWILDGNTLAVHLFKYYSILILFPYLTTVYLDM